MIDNKTITITKENQFDKGWTLFHPYELGIAKNPMYKDVGISEIVNKITHCDKIDLVLSEPCLSSRIINEIEWANKYIKVNIVVKEQKIINTYSHISFSSKTIDSNIDFNYIGIYGKDNGFYMITDGYIELPKSLEESFLTTKGQTNTYSFLNRIEEILISDSNGNNKYESFIAKARELNIRCSYVTNIKTFNKNTYDSIKKQNITLLVSDRTVDGILIIGEDRSIQKLSLINGSVFILCPIEKVTSFIGDTYKCAFYQDNINVSSLKDNVYSCYGGKIKKLSIVERKDIRVDVYVKLMSDFMNGKFDSSIIDNHNDYSAEAKRVTYIFNLIPPKIDDTYVESNIYNNIRQMKKEWDANNNLNIDKIIKEHNSIINFDYGIPHFLPAFNNFSKAFDKRVNNCDYEGFYLWVKTGIGLYKTFNESLLDIIRAMFKSINSENESTKFESLDKDIEEAERLLREKQDLIDKGINVLSNQNNVDRLMRNIENYKKLKNEFKERSVNKNDKEAEMFINHCNDILNKNIKSEEEDSIGKIINKEETRLSKLETFVEQYLFDIKKYTDKCLQILMNLEKENIPENYKVYDKSGERYIVIKDLSEYESTKKICNDFNLKCVTRG